MVHPARREFLALASLPAFSFGAAAQAQQPPYPERAVVLIAPFSAGGAADIAARTLAAHAPRHLPNDTAPIVVENRTGASGAVGTLHVARAKPDGQTLLLARVGSSAILPATDPRTPYAWDEFTMLGLLDENPYVICVRADAPWRTLGELLAALRETPGRLNFATTGPATILDLGIRHIFAASGLPIDAGVAIPFRGGGEAVAALLGGQVQFIGNNLTDTLGAIASGQLRALVVGTEARLPILPGVPDAIEAEVPTLRQITGWNALFAPPALADPVEAAWIAALAKLGRDPQWLAATRRAGATPRMLDPAATRAFVRDQVALYRDLARRLGLL